MKFISLLLVLFLSNQVLAIHFSYIGKPNDQVFLMSDFNFWGEHPWLMKSDGHGRFWLDIKDPYAEKVKYKFLVNGEWTHDSKNPYYESDGQGGINSIVFTGFQDDPFLERHPWTPYFYLTEHALVDGLGRQRIVYLIEPSFVEPGREVISLYFQDGEDYLHLSDVKSLLENLSTDRSLPLFRAILIPPVNRIEEYAFNDAYAWFLAKVIVPTFEKNLLRRRILIGPSLGGLISLYTSLSYPEVFPNIIAQSGAFWFYESRILDHVAQSDLSQQKIFLEWGSYEGNGILSSNIQLVEILKQKKADFSYQVFPAKHDWTHWRNTLRQALNHFL